MIHNVAVVCNCKTSPLVLDYSWWRRHYLSCPRSVCFHQVQGVYVSMACIGSRIIQFHILQRSYIRDDTDDILYVLCDLASTWCHASTHPLEWSGMGSWYLCKCSEKEVYMTTSQGYAMGVAKLSYVFLTGAMTWSTSMSASRDLEVGHLMPVPGHGALGFEAEPSKVFYSTHKPNAWLVWVLPSGYIANSKRVKPGYLSKSVAWIQAVQVGQARLHFGLVPPQFRIRAYTLGNGEEITSRVTRKISQPF